MSELQILKYWIQDGDYFTLISKFSNNWHKTCCIGIFWVADYDSEVRIGKFKIWCQNCKIRNGGSKMAATLVEIFSFFAIATKLGIWEFSRSLKSIFFLRFNNRSQIRYITCTYVENSSKIVILYEFKKWNKKTCLPKILQKIYVTVIRVN